MRNAMKNTLTVVKYASGVRLIHLFPKQSSFPEFSRNEDHFIDIIAVICFILSWLTVHSVI